MREIDALDGLVGRITQCSSSLPERVYSGATRLEYDLRRPFAEDWRPSQIMLTAGLR